MSSERDHAKAAFKAHTSVDRIVSIGASIVVCYSYTLYVSTCTCTVFKNTLQLHMNCSVHCFLQRYVPHFPTMFSSLRHFPRQQITLNTTDPVPQHVSRHWKGYGDQARQTLVRYKK